MWQPEIVNNLLKTFIFGVQRRSRLSMLMVPPESWPAVLVMISSKSVRTCLSATDLMLDELIAVK